MAGPPTSWAARLLHLASTPILPPGGQVGNKSLRTGRAPPEQQVLCIDEGAEPRQALHSSPIGSNGPCLGEIPKDTAVSVWTTPGRKETLEGSNLTLLDSGLFFLILIFPTQEKGMLGQL